MSSMGQCGGASTTLLLQMFKSLKKIFKFPALCFRILLIAPRECSRGSVCQLGLRILFAQLSSILSDESGDAHKNMDLNADRRSERIASARNSYNQLRNTRVRGKQTRGWACGT